MKQYFSNIPSELLENRDAVEGNFIFCLWKEPEFYDMYDKNIHAIISPKEKDRRPPTFKNKESVFFYSIGKAMYELGYAEFDEVSVTMYLEDKKTLKELFDRYGGYEAVKVPMNVVNTENIDVYFDELAKSNILIDLYKKGFNVLSDLNMLKQMSSAEIDDYYDYMLNETMIHNASFIEVEDLVLDERFVKAMQEGVDIGLQYNKVCKILNYITMGIPKGDLFMLGGHSGSGKSSFAFANMVIPVVENGHKACIISNEQNIRDFQIMLTAMTLANDLNYFGITRKAVKTFQFTDEQKRMFQKAIDITKEKYTGNLKFVRMFDYDNAKIKRVIRRLAKQGFELFMYDTFKSEGSADDWAKLINDSRELFQLVSKEDVAMVTTYQLAPSQLHRRFLDVTTLSNAKQIKEVYSEMVYFRPIWDDEFEGEKYDIKPYQMEKGADGKYTNQKRYIKLDRDKKYIIVFVDKTRNDEDKQTLVYEFNGRFNIWREIGFCDVHYDRY